MRPIRVAIVGVGNCASALVQGLEFYRHSDPPDEIPGLMHVLIDKYHVRDIAPVAAFDVHEAKVGRDLADAIFVRPNNTVRFADVPRTEVTVLRGPTLDGLGKATRAHVKESNQATVDVARALAEADADVVVSFLPAGAEEAIRFYAQCALLSGAGFVNCSPARVVSDRDWAKRFADAGLPAVGDDVKGQVSSELVHRVLVKLLGDRGVELRRTYQLNFGGNLDFLNSLDSERGLHKRESITRAVQSQLYQPLGSDKIHAGPSDFVPWLEDRKWSQIRLEGVGFGDCPVTVELKLEAWDSPNTAGAVIDAIRCIRVALDRGISGPLIGPSAYFALSPPVQFSDEMAREMVEEFITAGDGYGVATADYFSEAG